MATYSTNLALTLMATGEQSNTWGDTTNTNLGTLLEQAISGYVTQVITDGSSANTTITIPNGATGVARNMFIEMTGALTFSTTSLIVPANKKLYFIYNNTTGGFAVTVKVSGQTGVSVPNGKKMVLVSNGTDIVNAENYIASLSVGALTSGRVPYAGTSGLLQDSANLTFNGTTLTANTIGAFTLSGTVAGGGNQLNNVIIGTTTPLAGAFTTLSANDNTVLASASNTKTVQIGSLATPANVGALQHVFNGAAAWGGQSTVGGETDFGWNFYYYGGFKSRLADVASRLSFNATSGRVSFWTAPNPGSADAALTFTEALRIDATTGVTALGAMAVGNNLAVTGTLTSTLDATIYGLTVGRGGGAVATNTAVGTSALAANTTGDTSVACGYQALITNTSGYQNTATGYRALRLNLSGINNSSFGFGALQTNSTSNANSAFGASCLSVNTAASNSGFGSACLTTNSTGANNCGFGFSALNLNSSGSNNVAVGVSALEANTASNNTAVGYQAGYSNTTASYQTVVGYQAGYSHQTVGYNTFVGYQAGYSDTGGQQTAFGYQALKLATGGRSTAIGQQAAAANLTGSVVALGAGALKGNTTGIGNVGLGGTYSGYNSALEANQTGSFNVAVGDGALTANVSSNYNTAVGSAALYFNTASNNTAVGYQAGYTNQTGAQSVYIGYQAGYADIVGYNTIIGYGAGSGKTTGDSTTIIGRNAGAAAGAHQSQTLVGDNAGNQTTGSNNTFLGINSGYLVTTGTKNVILGSYTGSAAPISATGSNFVVLSDGDGNIVASTKTAQTFALQGGTLSAGTGIAFPATQSASTDANTLDDYEEGTWTPNQGSGLTVVGAFSSVGRYTKIGNVVTVWGEVTGATSIAVASAGFITTNLSFPVNNDLGINGIATGYWTANNAAAHISIGSASSVYAAQAISGSATIGFTITYRV